MNCNPSVQNRIVVNNLVHDHLQCEPCMLAFKYNMQAYLHYNNRWDSVMQNSAIIVEPKTSKQHYALDFLVSSK